MLTEEIVQQAGGAWLSDTGCDPTKAALLKRMQAVLKPGGLLFLGHSETLADREGLTPIGRTTFQKAS